MGGGGWWGVEDEVRTPGNWEEAVEQQQWWKRRYYKYPQRQQSETEGREAVSSSSEFGHSTRPQHRAQPVLGSNWRASEMKYFIAHQTSSISLLFSTSSSSAPCSNTLLSINLICQQSIVYRSHQVSNLQYLNFILATLER